MQRHSLIFPTLHRPCVLQVWFQNRRAKFRRNERSVLIPKPSHALEQDQVEQPLVPKNTVAGKMSNILTIANSWQ